MTERVYLDWNAAAPLRPQARAAMLAALDLAGHASEGHPEGRAARRLIEDARLAVAGLVGADARDVTFTSGGTEANSLALAPGASGGAVRLLVSAIEHPSVRSGGRFAREDVEEIPVTPEGAVDLMVLGKRLEVLRLAGIRPLVSLMLANNETGVIQPVPTAAGIVHAAGGILHVDAVQGPGRIACQINELGADLVTLSAHKIGGPKGIGALVRRAGATAPAPLISGGGQERSLRAGTENVAGIAGFGAAALAAADGAASEATAMAVLRERLERGLLEITPNAIIFGDALPRLPNTTLFALAGMKAETAVIAFDLVGIAVSSGAACSSGMVQPSHVLAAMGVAPDLARGAIRVSLGRTTTESDVERFLNAWKRLSEALLKGGQAMAAAAA